MISGKSLEISRSRYFEVFQVARDISLSWVSKNKVKTIWRPKTYGKQCWGSYGSYGDTPEGGRSLGSISDWAPRGKGLLQEAPKKWEPPRRVLVFKCL